MELKENEKGYFTPEQVVEYTIKKLQQLTSKLGLDFTFSEKPKEGNSYIDLPTPALIISTQKITKEEILLKRFPELDEDFDVDDDKGNLVNPLHKEGLILTMSAREILNCMEEYSIQEKI